jgi:hypothetical protein
MWIIGVCLVLAAAFIFFFATGLDRWIPFSIAAAAVILFIGLAVMSFAEKSPGEHHGSGGHTDVNVNEGHGHH